MNNDNNYNNPSHTFCIYSAFRKFHLISAQKMLLVGRCAICQQSNKPQGKQCTVMTCPNTKASLLVSVNYSISCQPCGFMRQHPVAGNTRVVSISRKVHRGRNFLLARVEHSVLTHHALSSNQKVSFSYSNVKSAADWISAITWIVRFSCISDFDWLVSKLTTDRSGQNFRPCDGQVLAFSGRFATSYWRPFFPWECCSGVWKEKLTTLNTWRVGWDGVQLLYRVVLIKTFVHWLIVFSFPTDELYLAQVISKRAHAKIV